MADKDPELRVVRRSSDGRRRYDDKGKRALVEEALRSGVSVARLAQEQGINANLLRKWITKYLLEREKGIAPASQDDATGEQERPHAPEEIVLEGALAVIDGAPIDIPGSRKRSPPVASATAFVPVVAAPPALPAAPPSPSPSMTLALHVRLSNGVEFDLGQASIDELTTVVQMLGRMPCSGSTKA